MKELTYFKKSSNPEINAALAGISKVDWKDCLYNTPVSDVHQTMKENKFDVIPIKGRDGNYISFYTTKIWGKYHADNVFRSQIRQEDEIYYLTNISDVVKLFYERQKRVFFLTNSREIIGLVSLNNLNCKHVYLHYYNLISLLERDLAQFVKSKLSVDQIMETLDQFGKSNQIRSVVDTVSRYTEDKKRGMDTDIVEYLYLSDIFILIEELSLFTELGYKTKAAFNEQLGKIKKLRNTIAHPNVSLINKEGSIRELWMASHKIDELESKIKELKK